MKVEKILLIHGPNLILLGVREPDIYGEESQGQLFKFIESSFPEIEFIFFQSNHEGALIDTIYDKRDWADAIIINAGAFSHYSYAIRDAIKALLYTWLPGREHTLPFHCSSAKSSIFVICPSFTLALDVTIIRDLLDNANHLFAGLFRF